MKAANCRTRKILERLIARGHDAAYLHRAALLRLSEGNCRRSVRAIGRMHAWRNLELVRAAAALGEAPRLPTRPGLRCWLNAVVLGHDDPKIMRTLADEHTKLVQTFEAALKEELPSSIRSMMERHRADLARHGAWLAYRVAELSGRPLRRGGARRPLPAKRYRPPCRRIDETAA